MTEQSPTEPSQPVCGVDDSHSDPFGSGETGVDLVLRLWNLVWLGERSDTFEELLTESFVRHTREGTTYQTPSGYRRSVGDATRNTTGTEVRIDHIEQVGDHVYARLTLLGVSLTTGDPMVISTIGDYRIEGGRIAESWMMHQPGLDWHTAPRRRRQ